MRASVLSCIVLACAPVVSTPPPEEARPVAEVPVVAEAPAPASSEATPPARRCLPVVAAECGCVYACGLGTEEAPGRWRVAHAFWAPQPVMARVDRWCVDGQCTEAFFGEIPCGAICSPRPAEPHCRLVEDRCEVDASVEQQAAREPALLRPLKTWPFVVWDRAEAITYNHVDYGPGIPLRVYDATHGWSPKIAERRPITREQAERAVSWVRATGGEVEVSKCAFPRHAVVLYAGETPVGTANVCFECGDILVWPDVDATATAQQQARAYKKKLAAYKKVFPQWERLFRDELGFSLTPQRP